MTERQILERARQLIVEHGWAKAASATDRYGTAVHVYSPDAAAYCITGALRRARHELTPPTKRQLDFGGMALMQTKDLLRDAVRRHEGEQYFGTLADWNDDPDRVRDDITRALDAAIERVS